MQRVTKGEELVKQTADSSCHVGPLTWDNALLKLYVAAGEVEKAESFLLKAVQQNQMKPVFTTWEAPVYRMRDRLKADNFFPNNALAENLAQVDALRKTVVSDLLD
ncbi:pentatricopeptide repeat-containing protein [Cucumis melo var. makuwa]|uniref:Pentatricopeptide repeat-containing protein n=1 Tax=Cucumis melo var. makuwa TaxID=1194695 RepID=A0A5D3DQB8_CUCMM|nr:pentatricopeptide repeat-containing protein [Cucumis melo var. makuwa]TYK25519.1 pentatricopeptide repeat-containing protein [Cucumis melo var. makuwa]